MENELLFVRSGVYRGKIGRGEEERGREWVESVFIREWVGSVFILSAELQARAGLAS